VAGHESAEMPSMFESHGLDGDHMTGDGRAATN
jgi:hypothetical protein